MPTKEPVPPPKDGVKPTPPPPPPPMDGSYYCKCVTCKGFFIDRNKRSFCCGNCREEPAALNAASQERRDAERKLLEKMARYFPEKCWIHFDDPTSSGGGCVDCERAALRAEYAALQTEGNDANQAK